MNSKFAWSLPVLALLALAGPASAAAPSEAERSCFYSRNISSFRPVDDKTVLLRVGVKDIYKLDLMGPCPDIDWSEQIGLVSRGSSWICSGLDAELVVPSRIGPQHCAVTTLRKLSPAEAAALPRKARP